MFFAKKSPFLGVLLNKTKMMKEIGTANFSIFFLTLKFFIFNF